MNKNLTLVTGLYDMGRNSLDESFSRPYSHYLEKFQSLLESTFEYNLIIFCSSSENEFIQRNRKLENTKIINKELSEYKTWFEFFPQVSEIRNQPKWKNQADWLSKSPQANLLYYAPFVLSKLFLLSDSVIMNPFETEYFLWLDGALTNTVHSGYFSHDKILDKITPYLDPFLFLSFPYVDGAEIHGFERDKMNFYSQTKNVEYVCRGGLFGGKNEYVRKFSGIYYELLKRTLDEGSLGTEESIFTILSYLYPQDMNRYMLEAHGMISNFCEAVKNGNGCFEGKQKISIPSNLVSYVSPSSSSKDVQKEEQIEKSEEKKNEFSFLSENKKPVSFYILTFNSPKQLLSVLSSLEKNQPEFLSLPSTKFCLDNSTDKSKQDENKSICERFGLRVIFSKTEVNSGICGGRQLVAEHFAQRDSGEQFYTFFEDDFIANDKDKPLSKTGFTSFIPSLFSKSLSIASSEELDFLKFCFDEFYMTNSTQVAWYNVSEETRKFFFPEQPLKLDNVPVPLTSFKEIKSRHGIPFALGDVFYCNWPSWISKKGSHEIFLNPIFRFPAEQTMMAHAFEKMKLGKIKTGILLATPFEHIRDEFYSEPRVEYN